MVMVSYDVEVGATYLELTSEPVAQTLNLGDLVMVDIDAEGDPVGVEFAVSPRQVTDEMLWAVVERFPALRRLYADRSWLLTSPSV